MLFRSVPPDPQTLDRKYLYAPCDGKVSVYPIQQESVFSIKHSLYKLEEWLEDTDLAKEYEGGTIWIFRLTPNDYHKYYFIDNGDIILFKHIPGILHTVQPIAFDYEKIFIKNSREVSVMNTSYWGKVVQIEVGALFIITCLYPNFNLNIIKFGCLFRAYKELENNRNNRDLLVWICNTGFYHIGND